MPADELAGRPQDQGRRHRRAGAPSAETVALLSRYQGAMRRELGALLDELEPRDDPQLTIDGSTPVKRLPIPERAKRWELAIRLARELGAEIDPAPVHEPSSTASSRRAAGGARKARARDFGGP